MVACIPSLLFFNFLIYYSCVLSGDTGIGRQPASPQTLESLLGGVYDGEYIGEDAYSTTLVPKQKYIKSAMNNIAESKQVL